MDGGAGEEVGGREALGASWTLFWGPQTPVGQVEQRTGLLIGVTWIWRTSHDPLDSLGAEIVKTPSQEMVKVTLSGLTPLGSKYLLTKCLAT